jgi:hypothetical protein
MEVTRRRGSRRKKLLDDLKDRRGYSILKEEALDHSMWRKRYGRKLWTCRQTEYCMNEVRQSTFWDYHTCCPRTIIERAVAALCQESLDTRDTCSRFRRPYITFTQPEQMDCKLKCYTRTGSKIPILTGSVILGPKISSSKAGICSVGQAMPQLYVSWRFIALFSRTFMSQLNPVAHYVSVMAGWYRTQWS